MVALRKLQSRGVSQGQSDMGNKQINQSRWYDGVQPQSTRYQGNIVQPGPNIYKLVAPIEDEAEAPIEEETPLEEEN